MISSLKTGDYSWGLRSQTSDWSVLGHKGENLPCYGGEKTKVLRFVREICLLRIRPCCRGSLAQCIIFVRISHDGGLGGILGPGEGFNIAAVSSAVSLCHVTPRRLNV